MSDLIWKNQKAWTGKVYSHIAPYLGKIIRSMHFFKKQIKGETFVEIKEFFRTHLKSTVVVFVSATVAFLGYYFALASGTVADVAAIFGLGYTFDSMFNRGD